MSSHTSEVEREDVQNIAKRLETLEQRMEAAPSSDTLSMVVFSGELDKLLAAFVIATGAAACGMKVSMFFTFWGTAGLKRKGPQCGKKSLIDRMFGWMLPGGFEKRKLSKMDFCGLGRRMMSWVMKRKNVPDLPTLIDIARETDVQICICEMSMSLMGIDRKELIDYPDLKYCGVAYFLQAASRSNTTLFI